MGDARRAGRRQAGAADDRAEDGRRRRGDGRGSDSGCCARRAGLRPMTIGGERRPDATARGAHRRRRRRRRAASAEKTPPGRELRWSMPIVSRDGAYAVATVRSADNEDRWLVLVDPETGKTRVLDALRDAAWVRESGGFGPLRRGNSGFLPDNTHFWFLSERDGWMHLYVADVAAPGDAGASADERQVGGVVGRSRRQTSRTFYLNTSEVASRRAPRLRDADRRRRAHEADVDGRRLVGRGVAGRQDARRASTRRATSRPRCT